METRRKIWLVSILGALIIVGGYFYFSSQNSKKTTSSSETEETTVLSKAEKQEKKEANQKSTDESVKRDDCENSCSRFQENQSGLQNCQQLCGINQIQDTEDCEGLAGAEKDNCIKGLASKQMNYNLCNLVESPEFRKSCKDRVSKDLFEELEESEGA